MRSLPLLVTSSLFVLSLPVAAQTLTLTVNNAASVAVPADSCTSTVTVQAVVTAAPTGVGPCSSGGELNLWLTPGDCGTAPASSGDLRIGSATNDFLGKTTTATFVVNTLPAFTEADGGTACGSAIERTYKLCGAFKVAPVGGACGDFVKATGTAATFQYDGVIPPAPTISEIVPADGILSVRMSSSATDIDTYRVRFRKEGTTDWTNAPASNDPTVQLKGLENGQMYEITATVTDDAGNVSADAEIAKEAPVQTSGYFDAYKNAGGDEIGGCSASGGGLWAGMLMVAAGWWLSRRRG